MKTVIPSWDIPSVPVAGTDARFPVRHIYCVGRNYAEHAKEMGGDASKEPPFFFSKAADSIMPVVPLETGRVGYPLATHNLHHEIEMVVAIGGTGVALSADRALRIVFGYAVGLDLTRRDLQNEMREKKRPWDIGKSFPQAAPIGVIHPVSKVGHPNEGRIWLDVNGARRQEGDLADMIWDVAHMMEFLMQYYELLPGDLIYTGTPAGVGAVVAGDRLAGGIDGLGTLSIEAHGFGMKLTAEEVERGYNNRAAVPNHPFWFGLYADLSEATRGLLAPKEDVRYGPGPKQTLDIFTPQGVARATFLFIHGGYWRALDKSEFRFVAAPFVVQDIGVVSINYDLCPQVSIATIARQCRQAMHWVVREGATHGLDTQRIVVGGHSAGGHLAAILLATDWKAEGLAPDPIMGAVSVSGVHDLTPLPLFSFNEDWKLDDVQAARLSVTNMIPPTRAPMLIATGADETSEFVRQAWLLWERWPDNRRPDSTAPLLIPGRNHFNIILDYAEPDSTLTRATLALFDAR